MSEKPASRRCPVCGAPISFYDALRLPTPFARLRCRSCGRRLKVARPRTLLAAGLSWGCALGAFWLMADWPGAAKAAVIFTGLAAGELAATWWIVKRGLAAE